MSRDQILSCPTSFTVPIIWGLLSVRASVLFLYLQISIELTTFHLLLENIIPFVSKMFSLCKCLYFISWGLVLAAKV